ncbi:MAG TPA: FAD-dependent monooxygenase, partial [Solirubrobacteraceae bacterium]
MDADVLIAGLGPVGQLLANLLGARGVRVLAVDPAAGPSALPRAATADDTVLRALQSVGLDSAVAPLLSVMERVSFVAADGRRLTLLEPGAEPSALGHPPLAGWHQPAVERVLCAGMARFASVDARWGCGVERLHASPSSVFARLSTGQNVQVGWVVGCDGARSAVRRLCGIGFGGSTFAQPWLVVDAEVDAGVDLPRWVHFLGDAARPAVTLPMGPGRHRWELMGGGDDVELPEGVRV